MKNQHIALLIFSLLSCTAHAKATVQDALNDAKYYANAVKGVSEADALADWKQNGKLPYKNTGELETIKVVGSECAAQNCHAYAQCPSGYQLTGGGWELTQYSGGTGFSAPNASYPDVVNNRWVLFRGGMDEWRGYRAYAVCIKNK